MSEIQSFIGGIAVTLFVAGIKPEKWVRGTFISLGSILGIVAVFWSQISPHVPLLTEALQSLVSNPWSWFLLVLSAAVIGNLIPAYQSRKTDSKKAQVTENRENLVIHYAGYGITDGRRETVTEKVKTSFQNGELPREVTNQWLGDAYKNQKKNLIVIFSEYGKTKGAVKYLDEHDWLELP